MFKCYKCNVETYQYKYIIKENKIHRSTTCRECNVKNPLLDYIEVDNIDEINVICCKCKESKPLDEFGWRKINNGVSVLQSTCILCRRENAMQCYYNNKRKWTKRNNKWMRENNYRQRRRSYDYLR